MGFGDLLGKAKGLIGGNKDKIAELADEVDLEEVEDAVEAAVDKVDDMTDGKVPDVVDDMVDKIDGKEG